MLLLELHPPPSLRLVRHEDSPGLLWSAEPSLGASYCLGRISPRYRSSSSESRSDEALITLLLDDFLLDSEARHAWLELSAADASSSSGFTRSPAAAARLCCRRILGRFACELLLLVSDAPHVAPVELGRRPAVRVGCIARRRRCELHDVVLPASAEVARRQQQVVRILSILLILLLLGHPMCYVCTNALLVSVKAGTGSGCCKADEVRETE